MEINNRVTQKNCKSTEQQFIKRVWFKLFLHFSMNRF